LLQAFCLKPFDNGGLQIGIIAKRPMHFGEVSRFADRANS